MGAVTDILILTLTGALGAMAFGVLYHGNPKRLLLSFLGGGITTLVYAISLELFEGNNMISNCLGSIAGGVFCTICAHEQHAPVPVFLLPSLIPLVPGRALYYSMSGFVLHNKAQVVDYLTVAAEISFGIAVGLMISNVLCEVFFACRRKFAK